MTSASGHYRSLEVRQGHLVAGSPKLHIAYGNTDSLKTKSRLLSQFKVPKTSCPKSVSRKHGSASPFMRNHFSKCIL